MDPLILNDVADSLLRLKMYPYFDICHYILMSTAVREDTPQSGSSSFSRKHPFACWFATMLMCFGGSILSSFVMGQPIFKCFNDHLAVLTASAVWYLINYSPFDIVYKLCKLFALRLLICAMKEVQRAKKISIGVEHAYHEYPDSLVTCLLSGLLKGTGSQFMRMFSAIVCGVWQPKSIEFLNISYTTKISFLAALVFYCEQLNLIPLPSNQIFLAVVSVLVYMRMGTLCMGIKDPFSPIQNLTCTIFFGGIVDALKSAISDKSSDSGSPSGPTQNSASGVPNAKDPAFSVNSGSGEGNAMAGNTVYGNSSSDKKRD